MKLHLSYGVSLAIRDHTVLDLAYLSPDTSEHTSP